MNFQTLEKLEEHAPNVLLCHCHPIGTPREGFERIKTITKEVRDKLSNCVIIITYNPAIDVRWCSAAQFGGRQDHAYFYFLAWLF